MQAVHVLEAHKAKRYALSLCDLRVRELNDLRRLGLFRIRRVIEAERRAVHEELDPARPLLGLACALDDKRADAHHLIELQRA